MKIASFSFLDAATVRFHSVRVVASQRVRVTWSHNRSQSYYMRLNELHLVDLVLIEGPYGSSLLGWGRGRAMTEPSSGKQMKQETECVAFFRPRRRSIPAIPPAPFRSAQGVQWTFVSVTLLLLVNVYYTYSLSSLHPTTKIAKY